eukprot:scaffold27547_cov96-Isochrysis_galbana.AAC.5
MPGSALAALLVAHRAPRDRIPPPVHIQRPAAPRMHTRQPTKAIGERRRRVRPLWPASID